VAATIVYDGTYPPPFEGSRVAVLTPAAAFAAQAHFPLLLRAPLGFLLPGVIPGWLMGRACIARTAQPARSGLGCV